MRSPSRLLPALDRPPRSLLFAGLIAVLLLDLILVLQLSEALRLLLILTGVVAFLVLASRLPWAVAFLAIGTPVLEPITLALGTDLVVFYALRLAVIASLFWIFFTRVERPVGLAIELLSDSAILLALGLGVLLALGSYETASPIYARMKLIMYGSTNLLLLVSGYVLARDGWGGEDGDRRLDRFLAALTVLALLIALAGLVNLKVAYYPVGSRLKVLGINPIWVARTMATGLLALIALRRVGRIGIRGTLLLASPMVIVLLLTGSRGPILGLFLALFVYAFLRLRGIVSRLLLAVIAPVGVGAAILLVLPEVLRERFMRPLTGDVSDFVRLRLVAIAREAFEQVSAFGIGTGGFSHLVKMGDMRAYPHNLFVEIGLENGILGLVALLAFFGIILHRCRRALGNPRDLVVALLFLFSVWNAQFSGDITVNETVWLFAGIIAARARNRR